MWENVLWYTFFLCVNNALINLRNQCCHQSRIKNRIILQRMLFCAGGVVVCCFFLIRPGFGVHSHSSSSSSPCWFWLCRASLAGLQLGGSPAPSGNRRGTPACRSGRGKDHWPSTPRTHRTSRRLEAEAEMVTTIQAWAEDRQHPQEDLCEGISCIWHLLGSDH